MSLPTFGHVEDVGGGIGHKAGLHVAQGVEGEAWGVVLGVVGECGKGEMVAPPLQLFPDLEGRSDV